MKSNYPINYDVFVNVMAENKIGCSKSEKRIIKSNKELNLINYAKKNTITISGFKEVFSENEIQPNTFYVSNYMIPNYSFTGINFEIGNKIKFHQDNINSIIIINYTAIGTKISSALFNWLFDCIYSIEHTIGTIGKYKDIEIGNYKNLAQFLSYLTYLLKNHTHEDNPLTENAISKNILTNDNFSDDANINQIKIKNGAIQYENDKITKSSLTIATNINETYKCIIFPESTHDSINYPIYPVFSNGKLEIKCEKENIKFDYLIFK